MGTEWNAENHVNDALRVETVLRQESKIQPCTLNRGTSPQVFSTTPRCVCHGGCAEATTPAALPNAGVYKKKAAAN